MQRVASSNIDSVGYEENGKVLTVQFKNGGSYQYTGVAPQQYQALLNAPSIGKHLSTHIKNTAMSVKKL